MKLEPGLEWKTISYEEENDTDNSLFSLDWTQEAPYRNGFLVRHVMEEIGKDRVLSITFVPSNQN